MFLCKGFLRIRFLQANTNILNVFMCTYIYEIYVCVCVKERKKRIFGIEIVTYIDRTLFVLLGLQHYMYLLRCTERLEI
jgi:hypothetical protein